jgi:transcriptional regulator
MYLPAAFRDDSLPSLHAFIRAHGFATLISRLNGELIATHVPLLLDAERGERGTLIGHVARANPHWQAFAGSNSSEDAPVLEETLAIFHGPHTYISPRWYAAPVAVPTWNYTAVHAYGQPRIITSQEAMVELLARTVHQYESEAAEPWDMARLPEGYVQSLLGGIVGFELPIARLEGKRKLSQNRSEADRQGVVTALEASGYPHDAEVAALMREHLPNPETTTRSE